MEWQIVCDKDPGMVRRMEVPGGWLYQTQSGRNYRGHPSNNDWYPLWSAAVYVPEPRDYH
jgi:hypothetical protein